MPQKRTIFSSRLLQILPTKINNYRRRHWVQTLIRKLNNFPRRSSKKFKRPPTLLKTLPNKIIQRPIRFSYIKSSFKYKTIRKPYPHSSFHTKFSRLHSLQLLFPLIAKFTHSFSFSQQRLHLFQINLSFFFMIQIFLLFLILKSSNNLIYIVSLYTKNSEISFNKCILSS